jgi:hypothetical protein
VLQKAFLRPPGKTILRRPGENWKKNWRAFDTYARHSQKIQPEIKKIARQLSRRSLLHRAATLRRVKKSGSKIHRPRSAPGEKVRGPRLPPPEPF